MPDTKRYAVFHEPTWCQTEQAACAEGHMLVLLILSACHKAMMPGEVRTVMLESRSLARIIMLLVVP